MLKIPYGKSDFKTLIEDNYFYQDRTSYIEILENYGPPYLVYLRPRRFGKSLFLSTLSYYYGLQYKADFEKLFGKTFIGKKPTPNANNYMVLSLDFSGIDTTTESSTFEGFLLKIQSGFNSFLTHYDTHFTKKQQEYILSQDAPNKAILALFDAYTHNKIDKKIYILIDEYDHFANEIVSFNFTYFSDMISKNGFVRKFYEIIKIGTGQGIVERLFITGVAPLTMDSMTSGFNISTNITLSPVFHQMVGFQESEVATILEGIEIPTKEIPAILADMRSWYNGYLFSTDATHKVYNPSMVLYFVQKYKERNGYPKELLDANIASDYSKIRQLFKIQGKEEAFLPVLQELSEKGEIQAILTGQYSFERDFTQSDLISLLFYMGLLTIAGEKLGRYNFSFPNYVIKKLYADYFLTVLQRRASLPINNQPVNEAIIEMAETGLPDLFFQQVSLIVKRLSTRDSAHFNENALKAIIVSLLHQQSFYYIHSEYESDWTYMDVFLEAIRGQKPTYEVALELKYLKKKQLSLLESTFKSASDQLKGYLDTPKFNSRSNTKSWVLVCVGDKLHWRAVK